MWFVWIRDWWNNQLDRFVEHRIRRAADRVTAEITIWMADNAKRTDLP